MPSHFFSFFLLFISIFPAINIPAYSQHVDTLPAIETNLVKSYNSIFQADSYHRDKLADAFYEDLYTSLIINGSFNYPFDSLIKVGKIYSPDYRLRIYTWNIPVGLSDNLYFGIIQYLSSKEKTVRIVRLNEPVASGLNMIQKDWQQTLYFQVIETKHAGQKYYTLLGFNFNTLMSNSKSVDVVSIDNFDQLYFCEKLFLNNGKEQDRIVFEYNEKAVMMLRYDADAKMIVFDHLAPSKPSLEGKFEFYGPDFTYDGLKFEKGVWVYYSNISITN
jgi:hypothetical protein